MSKVCCECKKYSSEFYAGKNGYCRVCAEEFGLVESSGTWDDYQFDGYWERWCLDCKHKWQSEGIDEDCPECGSNQINGLFEEAK